MPKETDDVQRRDHWRDLAHQHLLASADVKHRTAERCLDAIVEAAAAIEECFRSGGKVLICGNGGSAADAQHMAAEFVNRLSSDLDRPGLPAIALTTDTSFLTAYANDAGFDGIFERQVLALAKPGDTLVAISTSGNSSNVVRGVITAQQKELVTIGLLGEGGELTNLVDHAIVVPSRQTQHIQETLLAIEHVICQLVEQALFRPEMKERQ